MREDDEAVATICSPGCPALKPVRPGPLLITPGPFIGHGLIRSLALPLDALEPSTRYNDPYKKLAPVTCAGIVLNDMVQGDDLEWNSLNLSDDGYWRPLFGLWTCENAFGDRGMAHLASIMEDLRTVSLIHSSKLNLEPARSISARDRDFGPYARKVRPRCARCTAEC